MIRAAAAAILRNIPRGRPASAGRMTTATRKRAGRWALCTLPLALLGCNKPPHNMELQPKYLPDSPSPFFADGTSDRPLLTGTVPRPANRTPGFPYVAVVSEGPVGFGQVATSDRIPMPITRALLERGQERFGIYCAVCHGQLGDGNGEVPDRGFQRPPSFHTQRFLTIADSHFYNVITNGYGTMFSYADRVAPDDRWAIAAYIRALQAGVKNAADLTPAQHHELEAAGQ